MSIRSAWPAPGLDFSRPIMRKLPGSGALRVMQMRRRFARNPDQDPIRAFEATKTIFVRVPKNASNSITSMLYPDVKPATLPHFSAEFYRRVFPLEFRTWLVFAPLRNPMERLASAFTYYREKTTIPAERRLMDEELPFLKNFSDFVHWLNDIDDLMSVRIMQWHHFRKQTDYICDSLGNNITNLLFPVEDMDVGLKKLCAYAGVENRIERLNASRKFDFSSLPMEHLENYYASDISWWEKSIEEKVIERN